MPHSQSVGIARDNRRTAAVLFAVAMLVASAAPVAGIAAPSDSPGDLTGTLDDGYDDPYQLDADPDSSRTAAFGGDEEPLHSAESAPPSDVSPSTVTNVTLITGQTVRVIDRGDDRRYDADTDEVMYTAGSPDGTYVFPKGVDFDRFDPELFNVDRLIEDGYADNDTDSVPVIIRERTDRPDRGNGIGVQDTENASTWVGVSEAFEQGMAGKAGLEVASSHASIGAVSGAIDKSRAEATFEELRNDDTVERVHYDARYEVQLDDAGDAVSAEQAWTEYNVSGEGVTVAVLDTGVDSDHPDLEHAVVYEKDFTGEGTTHDEHGHGTHVAGIVAGSGDASDGDYVGIAPNASIMDLRVLGSDGGGSSSDIIEAMEYADQNGADIISMSLGGPTSSDDPFFEAVDSVVANGTTVIVAAGNDGDEYETIASPGVVPSAITVGASDDYDEMAWFSSRGPTPERGYVKPDLVAPGVSVNSASADTDSYTEKSGTSMAAPVVSGAAALLIEHHGTMSPTEVKSQLVTTADDIGDHDVYTAGSGRLNATAALRTDIVIDQPTTDFQSISADSIQQQTVTVTNDGDEQQSLDLSASATSISGATGNVSLNQTEIILDPGETTHIEVEVTADTSTGTYSGQINFEDGHHVVNFGYQIDPKYTLTVEKEAINDTDVDGDYVFLQSHERGGGGVLDTIDSPVVGGTVGETSMGVMDGNYTVFTVGTDESTGKTIIMGEKLTIEGNNTVTFDEAETSVYSLDSSDLEAETDLTELRLHSRLGTVRGTYTYLGMAESFPENEDVRFSEGAFNASVLHLLAPGDQYPDEERHFDTPVAYHLFHQTEGVAGNETFVADRDTLGEEEVTYYQPVGDANIERLVDNPILNDPIPTGQWSPRDRETQTIYSSPSDTSTAPTYRLEVEDENGDWITRAADDSTLAGGEETPVAVNKHPYTGLASVDVGEYADEDNVQLFVNPQVSQGPIRGVLEPRDDSTDYTVTRDGSVVDQGQTDGPSVSYSADESLSDGTTYEIVTEAGNGDRALSTSTRTMVRTTYTEGSDNTPPTVADISPPELSTENSVPTGPVEIDLAIEDDNPEDLTVLVRYADGTVTSDPYDGSITDTSDAWHDASVTAVDAAAGEYRATIDTDLGTDTVHLEVAVLEEGGNAISTATYDAYAVDDREAGGVVVTDASLTDETIWEGETAEATATVTNLDSESTEFDAEFRLTDDGGSVITVATETLQLNAEESTTVTLSGSVDLAGTYSADVSGEPAGQLTVEGPAVFELSEGTLNQTEIEPGESVEATATVENLGDETGTVTAELEVNGSVEQTTNETLAPGESTTVAFEYEPPDEGSYGIQIVADDNDGGETAADAGTLTVSESDPAEFTVSNAQTSADTILEGEEVTITADVENVGDESGTFTAELQVDGTGVESQSVTLDGGEMSTVSFDRTFDEAGTYKLAVSDEPAGELTVTEPGSPAFEVRDLSVDENPILEGESAQFTATVENVGDAGGDHTAELFVDGSVQATETVHLDSGESTTVSFTEPFDEAGDYSVTVDSADPLTLTVQQPAAFETNEASLSDTEIVAGDAVQVSATVENVGDVAGNHTAELIVDGSLQATETIQLDGAASTDLTFTHAFDTSGSYDVAVDDATAGTVTVLEPADVRLSKVTLLTEEIEEGETADVNVTLENVGDVEGDRSLELRDGNEILTVETVTVSPGDSITTTIGHPFQNPGEYELHVDDRFAGNLTVVEADGSDDSGNDGGSGGGAGGGPPPGFGSSPADDVEPEPEPSVSIDRIPTGSLISVTDPSTNVLELEFDEAGDGSFVHNSLHVTPGEDADDFQLEVSPPSDSPAEAPAPTDHRAIGYLAVERIDIANEDIEEAEFAFTLRDHQLPADAEKEAVTMLRYHDGEWQELETEHQWGDRYVAVTPGFSEFAVAVEGAPEAAFDIVDEGIEDRSVEVNERVTLYATIENVGAAEGTYETRLLVDDDPVSTADLTLGPGETDSVELSTAFEEPGTYNVALAHWEKPIEVTVEPSEETTQRVEERTSEEPAVHDIDSSEDDDDETFPFPDIPPSVWIAGLIGMVLVASLVNLLAIGPELFPAPNSGDASSRSDDGTTVQSRSTATDTVDKSLATEDGDVEEGDGTAFDWIDGH